MSNNVDEAFFKASGYSIHDFNDSSHSAFNAVIASRLPADYEYINLEYTYGFDPVFLKPFYSARVIVNSIPILIIGAHIPPAIMMPNELKELRLKAFTEIAEMIADGKLSKSSGGSASQIDDLIILAGDLNTFPSDDILSSLLSSGYRLKISEELFIEPNAGGRLSLFTSLFKYSGGFFFPGIFAELNVILKI